ncbi:fibronectin type III domain-containing protein [Robertkochia sediminum]|uniref:hypothetical protein n=1 Tax=Robertkochia sediminum TaxID=2785326 RepID=UPI00193326BC|nr:hypothetical protein [Robertkochia sediminum]MBL7473511.1 hypothetical protein [Robertkochia sediminum]
MNFRVGLVILLLSVALFWSCERDDPPAINEVPSAPIPQSPENYSILTGKTVLFTWNAAKDPEGQKISYNLQLSTNADFTEIIFSDVLHTPGHEITVPDSGFYFWRVRARDDSKKTSAFSERQNFCIASSEITNYPPFPPERRFPELDEVVNPDQVDLGWSAFDLDDTSLSYNVYVGTEYGSQNLVAQDITEDAITLKLEEADVYYWKVEAIDPSGNRTESPIWWFTSI